MIWFQYLLIFFKYVSGKSGSTKKENWSFFHPLCSLMPLARLIRENLSFMITDMSLWKESYRTIQSPSILGVNFYILAAVHCCHFIFYFPHIPKHAAPTTSVAWIVVESWYKGPGAIISWVLAYLKFHRFDVYFGFFFSLSPPQL